MEACYNRAPNSDVPGPGPLSPTWRFLYSAETIFLQL